MPSLKSGAQPAIPAAAPNHFSLEPLLPHVRGEEVTYPASFFPDMEHPAPPDFPEDTKHELRG